MAYRNLTDHEGREWRYVIGKTFVEIRSPNDNKFLPTHAAVADVEPDQLHDEELERVPITPAMIKTWIKRNVTDDPPKPKKKRK